MSVLYPRARTPVLGLGQESIEALLEAAGGVRVLVGAGGRGAARRPQAGSGPGRSGLPAPLPGHHSTQYGLFFRTGRHIVAGAGALPRARRRCEAGKRTHGPGTRACLALLAATALLALAAPAQAQTEMVPADWALKPADLGAGEQFRLIFVSSTGRDALSTDIADYNTFVRTRAQLKAPPARRMTPYPARLHRELANHSGLAPRPVFRIKASDDLKHQTTIR